jgi:hypothetical protein
MKAKIIVPFRDRGTDAHREANLEVVMAWWWARGLIPDVADDGLEGDAPFNRHRAYYNAVDDNPDIDTFVFTEADMLIHPLQIKNAVIRAAEHPGLVVPFTQYRYLSQNTTEMIREVYHERGVKEIAQWWSRPIHDPQSIFSLTPESVMDNGKSIGAVNVVSRETLDLTGGFTEATSGNWYDDNIIEEGFTFLTGQPTRWVSGPAVHLYHLPGHKGDHLTDEDKNATYHNKLLLEQMRRFIRLGNRVGVENLMAARGARA